MPPRRDYDQLFADTRTAFTNARDLPEVQALLVPFGYDPVRLDAGLALIDAAEDATRAQQTEYAEQFAATSDLSESVAELRASYMRHVKLARVLFPPGTGEHTTLGLSGDRRDDLPGLIAQTEAFYRALLADARLLARTETVRLDQASAEAGLAQVEAVEAARASQAKETGEAQVATAVRDDAVSALRGYWSDFRRVAEVALEEHPQLRETLGLLERS